MAGLIRAGFLGMLAAEVRSMRQGRRTWATCVLCALAVLPAGGCASQFAVDGNVVTPLDESRWLDVSSAHFRVITDLGREDAVDIAVQLERAHRMLSDFTDFLFPGRTTPALSTLVVQLRSRQELEELTGKEGYNGMFTRRGVWNGPTLLAFGDLTDETRATLVHEMAHRMVDHHAAAAAPWLHEGIARFFESLVVRDGQARLGEIPRTVHIGRGGFMPYQLPSVKQLLTANHGQFHDAANPNRAKERLEGANYTGAWGLVHLLNNGIERYRPRFLAMLASLTRGEPMAAAWQAGFAGVPLDDLERDYRSHYLLSDSLVFVTPYETPTVPAPEVSPAPRPLVASVLTSIYRNMRRGR